MESLRDLHIHVSLFMDSYKQIVETLKKTCMKSFQLDY